MKNKSIILILGIVLFVYCSTKEIPKILINIDHCDYCRMTISDERYASALVTQKGRIYKFDDISCMLNYCNENKNIANKSLFVSDFVQSKVMIPVEQAYFIQGVKLMGPMQGHVAAFANRDSALVYQKKYEAKLVEWELVRH